MLSDRLERAYEREVGILEDQRNSGQLTDYEFNEAMRELNRDFREYEKEGGSDG